MFVVSSGPKKYSGVAVPDPGIVAELEARGQVLGTDVDDAACAANAAKIGPDADGQPGGCDNVRVLLGGTPPVQVSVFQGSALRAPRFRAIGTAVRISATALLVLERGCHVEGGVSGGARRFFRYL